MEIDWADFLGRPRIVVDASLAESLVRDKCVLITGAGGSIGSGLARAVVFGRPRTVLLLDLSEGGLYDSCRSIASASPSREVQVVPAVGSAADRRLLNHLFEEYRPNLILHAAAYKHVTLMERNPFSAIANNAIGTYRLARAALDFKVSRLVMVSTDKAVNPIGIMGVSKRVAELVVLSHGTKEVGMNAVRLGNVLGSSGSVAPLFQEQAENGLPLTVTHPEAARYFLAAEEATAAILQAAGSAVWGKILVASCGEPFSVVHLARYVTAACGVDPEIRYIGLRPGEKLREELLSTEERVESELSRGMRIISSPAPPPAMVSAVIDRLQCAVENFDLVELGNALNEIAPNYKLSQSALPDRSVVGAR